MNRNFRCTGRLIAAPFVILGWWSARTRLVEPTIGHGTTPGNLFRGIAEQSGYRIEAPGEVLVTLYEANLVQPS